MSIRARREKGNLDLQTSLLILIAAIVSVSLLVQVFSIQPYIQEKQIEITQDEQATATLNLHSLISNQMDGAIDELSSVAELKKFKKMDVSGLSAPLQLLTTISHSFTSFFVINSTGWFVAGTTDDITVYQTRSFADNEFFSQPFNTETPYFGSPKKSHGRDSVSVTLSVPIYDYNGDVIGVVLGTVDIEDYLSLVHEFTLEEGITAVVVDKSGIVFAHSGTDLFSLEDGPLSLNYSTHPCVQQALKGESGRGQHTVSGEEVFGTWMIYEKAGWGIVLTSPIQSIIERTQVLTQSLLSINLAVFISTLGVSLVLTRRITQNQKDARDEIEFLARFPQENINPVLRVNRDGVILYSNDAAVQQLVGWNPAVGEKVSEEWLGKVKESLNSGLKAQFEQVYGERVFSFNLAPVVESGYVNIYGRDITEQKKAETAVLNHSENLASLVAERTQELEESNRQLRHLDEMKNSFISSAAHELRTPLTTIKGYQELVGLHDDALPDVVKQYMAVSSRSTDRLVKITDDLLDLQRINTGRLELNKETVDLVQLVDNVADELTLVAKERDIELIVEHQNPIESQVDPLRVAQVTTNIIHNAIKFSEDGGHVWVSTSVNEGNAVISCRDDGIGIDKADQSRLFSPFPGIIRDNKYRSTGLGLSISKGIVELHGGTIWAESEGLGKGSVITFTIPIQ